MNQEKENDVKLLEACCSGDEETLRSLLEKGVNVNAQHSVNGMTALHWASKRAHKTIVAHLLSHGADKTLKTKNGESPADLSSDPAVRRLLGADANGELPVKEEMPFTPNYMAQPPFPYVSQSLQRPMFPESPAAHIPHAMNTSSGQAHYAPMAQQHNPDTEELVLKARVANVSERDFIEVELDRKRLTYENLVGTLCSELQLNRTLVQKIRKLPDTIVRKDKDVRRLKDFQEMEVVLNSRSMSESSRTYGQPSVSPRHVDVVY